MKILAGPSEEIQALAETLGVPKYWERFTLNVAQDAVVTVECEYAVSGEPGAKILQGKFRLEHIE